LINNRQGGRRRGRGGGSGRAPNMNPGAGNRQDNRQRGNAAQLLEKYKGLARDAQMQGDRVQSEYYLQFSDHYYRILNETRARYEEQRRQQGGYDGPDEDEDQDEMAAAEPRERFNADESDVRDADEGRQARPQGNGEYRGRRPRGHFEQEHLDRDGDGGGDGDGGERIAPDSLPPAIAVAPEDDDGAPRAPRRRARRPRDAGEEIAPAA
jgi:hypothetical protein